MSDVDYSFIDNIATVGKLSRTAIIPFIYREVVLSWEVKLAIRKWIWCWRLWSVFSIHACRGYFLLCPLPWVPFTVALPYMPFILLVKIFKSKLHLQTNRLSAIIISYSNSLSWSVTCRIPDFVMICTLDIWHSCICHIHYGYMYKNHSRAACFGHICYKFLKVPLACCEKL